MHTGAALWMALAMHANAVETARPLSLTENLPPIHGFRLSGSVYDPFDQRYADPGNPEHVRDWIPRDGLTLRVSLQYVF